MAIRTTTLFSGVSSTTSRGQQPLSTQPQTALPPVIVIRMPQTSAFFLLPASSADVIAPCATEPQLHATTDLLNLPEDLLRRLASSLRTANTLPAIRNVAQFRATCKGLYSCIVQPIPDGMMGLIEFNRLEELEQLLVQLEQSGKNVALEVNRSGDWVKIRDSGFRSAMPLVASAYLGHADMAAVLINAGAGVDRTALSLAIEKKRVSVIELLRAHGATD